MTTLEPTIELIREQYPYLSREYGVGKIGVFGSVAKKTEGKDSDIDIVVEFRNPIGLKFIELVEYLENLFDAKVDVLTQDGIENIRIEEVADDIKRNIISV